MPQTSASKSNGAVLSRNFWVISSENYKIRCSIWSGKSQKEEQYQATSSYQNGSLGLGVGIDSRVRQDWHFNVEIGDPKVMKNLQLSPWGKYIIYNI